MKLPMLLSLTLSIAVAVVLPTAIEPTAPTAPIATGVAIALAGASGAYNITKIFLADNNPAAGAAEAHINAEPKVAPPTAITPLNANTAATATKPRITYLAHATQTTRPSDPEPIIIFPFSMLLTEYCSSPTSSTTSRKRAKALLQNGDFKTLYENLSPSTTALVDHRIPDFPHTFRIGPYDAVKGQVTFSYLNEGFEGGCTWWDGEAWRECGECRAGGWDGEGVDCEGGGGGRVRTKTMECSFILGWKHQFNGLVAPPSSLLAG